jgi:hypothetical protein
MIYETADSTGNVTVPRSGVFPTSRVHNEFLIENGRCEMALAVISVISCSDSQTGERNVKH